jgi:hypothetical protein
VNARVVVGMMGRFHELEKEDMRIFFLHYF